MRQIRVTLECGRPHSNAREWFSTILLLSEEEIADDEHIAIAKYRARIQGYVEPFEVFQPSVARGVPSPDAAPSVAAPTVEQQDVQRPGSSEMARPDGSVQPAASWAATRARR